ncbi:hypothetical protein C2845_PM05G35780 [Panicum miliaceum]|uniref:Uncharacterized protein n=1 Tax=Panicum miliaceum TaxID=4540 RepID=A0A3L6T2F0_PANMI|nr:hypothetical protein C2845_PM05G35780 [Panicum miliaceum]
MEMELRAEEEEDKRGLYEEKAQRAAAVPAHVGGGKGGASSSSFARRCVGLVRERRARLYIARRCVTMLACWRDTS